MLGLGNKLGLGSKSQINEDICIPPSDDSYPMISMLYAKNDEIVNALSLTVLDLINKDQIKCDIDLDDSYEVGKELTPEDMEVMKKITLRIANKGELKTSESLAIKLLKNMNKNKKKFNLKAMAKQSNISAVANKFENDFDDFINAVDKENGYDGKNYGDVVENGKFTDKGKELKNEWMSYQNYLASSKLTEEHPPQSDDENSAQIIYAACFGVERDALKIRQNNTPLTDFIDKDGYKLLNIIFNNALRNVSEKRRGNGIFYGVNDKYSIPGGA